MVKNDLVVIVSGSDPIYHGSGTQGIKNFTEAENDTIGAGVYFTSEIKAAEGYARRRTRERRGLPVVYSCSVEGLKFLDFRNKETLYRTVDGFKEILDKKLERAIEWCEYEVTRRSIEMISERKYHPFNIKNLTFSHCKDFSKYLQSLGYDGLIAYEGGEGTDVGNHDTWLVFDPCMIKIIQEKTIE